MKLSFSTLGCPEWTYREIIATAKDLGYDGVEIRGIGNEIYAPKVPQFLPDAIDKTRAQFEGLGLEIPCFDTDNMIHQLHYMDMSKAKIRKYIALAQKFGAPYVRVLSDFPITEPASPVNESIVVDAAQELSQDAAKAGVTLLLETHGWYCDSARLAKLLDRIASPNVAALWDVHHPYRFCGEQPKDTVGNLGKYIKHVHIKDSSLVDGAVKYQMMGKGDLPIEGFVQALADAGYGQYLSLEWLRRWDLTLEVPGIVFAQYIGYMKALLA